MSQDNAMELLSILFAQGEENVEQVNSGTAVALSLPSVATTTVMTLNGAAPVITLPAPQVVGARKTLYLVQDGTGGRVPSFAGATVAWVGSAPVFSTTPAAIDKVTLQSLDGTTWEATAAVSGAGVLGVMTSPGLVSGTAKQDATGVASTWYVSLTGGAAGTVQVAIGPTSGVANVVVPIVAANAVASQVIPVRVPAGWWIKVTVAVATIAGATVVTG